MKKVKTVRARILFIVGAAIVAMLLLTLVNFYSVEAAIQALSSVYENRVQPVAAIQQIDRDLKDVRFRMAGVLLDQMPAVGSNVQLHEATTNIPAQWALFKEQTRDNASSAETRDLITKIDHEIPSFLAFSSKLSVAYESGDDKVIRSLLEDEWPAVHAGLLKPIDQLMEQQEQAVKTTYDESRKRSRWLVFSGFVAFVGATILIAFVGRKSERQITQPLGELIGVARSIGESGDLNQQINVEREDELGELARTFGKMVAYLKEMAGVSEAISRGDLVVQVEPRSSLDVLGNAFRDMTDGLRDIVGCVRESSSQVASGAVQIAHASDDSAKTSAQSASAIEEVTSTMHEMSVNIQSVVTNTQAQAASVGETSASIHQMVTSIQRVADTAQRLSEISGRSRNEVQSGIAAMQKATDGLSKIKTSISSSSDIIGELGVRAEEISKIIEVIDDISEQTNLLALNAAIEAARAGEHGLGFAVVADEVRKLAEKSAASTKEVSDIVQSIQKNARKAVENMDRSTVTVNEGLALGAGLSSALGSISSVVGEVDTFAQQISGATAEQTSGSIQISKATERLNEITQEITSSVEEQSSGAVTVVQAMERMRDLVRNQSTGSNQLAASADQMSNMARTLQESMDRFVLDTDQLAYGQRRPKVTGDIPPPPPSLTQSSPPKPRAFSATAGR